MKRASRWWALAALAALGLGLGGCSSNGSASKDGGKTGGRPPVAVEVLKVVPAELSQGIEVVGSLAPKYEASVKSEYSGIVAEVMVDQWVRVRKGQPLARLDTSEAEVMVRKAQATAEAAEAGLLQAQVASRRSERELSRLMKLKEVGLVTQQNLDDGRTDQEASTARMAAAQAQLQVARDDLSHSRTRLGKALITAPFDGVIAFRGVSAGDKVGEPGADAVLFKVVDPRLLDLTVNVPSKDMAALKLGQPLSFTTDVFPGRTFTGRVMFINPTVNQADRSVKVVAEVPNPEEILKGGLFVKGRIITGQRHEVLMVPRAALATWDVAAGKAGILVLDGQTARARQVSTGAVSGEMVEITQGLQPGEEIVTRGGFNVKDGDRVKVMGQGGA